MNTENERLWLQFQSTRDLDEQFKIAFTTKSKGYPETYKRMKEELIELLKENQMDGSYDWKMLEIESETLQKKLI